MGNSRVNVIKYQNHTGSVRFVFESEAVSPFHDQEARHVRRQSNLGDLYLYLYL